MELAGCLRMETRLFCGSSALAIESSQGQGRAIFSCTIQSVGGALLYDRHHLPSSSEAISGITWQIDNGSGGELRLTEFDSNLGPRGPVAIKFPCQLFPALVLLPAEKGASSVLLGLLSTGALFCIQFDSADEGSLGRQASKPCILDLSAQLSNLGSPTCLSTAGDCLIIGGTSGSVMVLPRLLQSVYRSAPLQTFELRESSWGIKGLINSVWQRSLAPSVVSCMPVSSPAFHGDQDILLVAYDDGTLRAFGLSRRVQVMSEHLDSMLLSPREPMSSVHSANGSTAPNRAAPKRSCTLASSLSLTFATAFTVAPPSSPASGSTTNAAAAAAVSSAAISDAPSIVVVCHFESRESATHHTAVYRLSQAPGSRGRLAVRESHELTGMEPSASVIDARLDPANDTCLWLLCKALGTSHVASYDCTSGNLSGGAVLQEGLPPHSPTTFQAGRPKDSMAMELWDCLATSPSGSCSASSAAQQQALAHVAVPGLMCSASLRDALAYHGVQAAPAEVETAGMEELKSLMRSAVANIRLRNQSAERSHWAWAQLMASYHEAWTRRHPVLSLVSHRAPARDADSFPGWLGCVRGGGMVSALRHATLLEGLGYADASSGGADVAAVAAQLPPGVLGLHRWLKEAAALLGPLCLDSFVQLVITGVDAASELIPRLTSLWLYGPTPNIGRALDDAAREQHTAWRRSRQNLLLELDRVLGEHADPVAVLKQCCSCITALESQAVAQEPELQLTPGSLPQPVVTFLATASRQIAYAQCSVARDLLLLLGIVQHLRSTGGLSLSGAALAGAEAELLPALHAQLQRSAIVYWLCSTLATEQSSSGRRAAGEGSTMDQALSSLRLGSPDKLALATTATTYVPRPSSTLPYNWQQDSGSTLVARLMPHLLNQMGSKSDAGMLLQSLDKTAVMLVKVLELGDTSSSGESDCSVPSRVMDIGYRLFLRSEYKPLHALKLLSGASGMKEAGPEFLHGLGMTCQLSKSFSYGHAREEVVNDAAACFFRAASTLTMGRGSKMFLQILRGLRQHLTGLPQPPYDDALLRSAAPGSEDAGGGRALLVLHYYEAVMMLYEREGAAEGAIMFARAALQQLPAVYGGPDACASMVHERLAMEGRLWANIFSYCCESEKYEEAYAAVCANPLSERALDCLRRLIHELSERGALLTLCSLPLASTLLVTSSSENCSSSASSSCSGRVSLLEEAIRTLQRRAHNSDLGTCPQPYYVLHDFHMARSDLQGAARALLAYARRLRAEGKVDKSTVERVMAAYEGAINELALLDEGEAWIDLTDPWFKQYGSRGMGVSNLFTTSSAAEDGASCSSAWGDAEPALTLAMLRQEYQLVRCACICAEKAPGTNPLHQLSQPDDVFSHLLHAGLYDDCLLLANECWCGEQLTSALERVLGSFAGHCAQMQLQEELQHIVEFRPSCISTMQLDIAERDELLGRSLLGSSAAPLWQRLQQLVSYYESETTAPLSGAASDGLRSHGSCLRSAVAEGILKVDRRMCLPPWLLKLFNVAPVTLFESGLHGGGAGSSSMASGAAGGSGSGGETPCVGPSELLEVYLAHERWVDAVAVVCELLAAWERVDPRVRKCHGVFWLPVQRLSLLRTRLAVELERGATGGGEEDAASVQALLRQLDAAMKAHMELAARDSGKDVGGRDGGRLMLGAASSPLAGWQAPPPNYVSEMLLA